jgi:hypothetical protein
VRHIALSVACSFLLLSLVLSACTSPRPPPSPTEGSLTLSDAPVLGKPVEVIYTFWLSDNIKWDTLSSTSSINVTANIKLSNKFELVDGNLQWQGDLRPGKKTELKATIKAVKKGNCEISANAVASLYSATFSGSGKTLYILILTDRAFFADKPNDLPGEDGYGTPYAISMPTSDEIVILPHLSLPHPPSLGETADLTLLAKAMLDAKGARISVTLPREVELVSGNLEWTGDMAKGDEIELKAVVKATKVGKWIIQTSCAYSPNPTTLKYLPSDYLTLYVFKDGADTVEGPPIKAIPKVNIDISFSNLPPLHQQAELTCRVVAVNDDLPKARIGINWRTSGFQLISGNPDWEGDMEKGIPIEIRIIVEPNVIGTLELMASVSAYDENKEIDRWVADNWIYVQVTEDSASLVPPPTRIAPSPAPAPVR